MTDKGFWDGSDTAHSPLASLLLDALRDVLEYCYDFEIMNSREDYDMRIQVEKMVKWFNEHIYTIEYAKGLNDTYKLIEEY